MANATSYPVHTRFDGLELLHPLAKDRFDRLAALLREAYADGSCKSLFLPFETYRTPQRQNWLLSHSVSTKVGAFGSSHQFGLAVDFVAFDVREARWSWRDDEDWDRLDALAAVCGLVRPIKWDRPHIEHPSAGYLLSEVKAVLNRQPRKLVDGQQVVAGYEPDNDDQPGWVA